MENKHSEAGIVPPVVMYEQKTRMAVVLVGCTINVQTTRCQNISTSSTFRKSFVFTVAFGNIFPSFVYSRRATRDGCRRTRVPVRLALIKSNMLTQIPFRSVWRDGWNI
jgi:hypothetical protein